MVKTEPRRVFGEAVTVVEVVQEEPAKEEGAKEAKRGSTTADIASTRQQAGSL